MAHHDAVYEWERLPEYRSTQQLARTVGRILVTLPLRHRRLARHTLTRAPVIIARGIAGANAALPPDADITPADREEFRSAALEGAELLRELLRLLRTARLGSQADVIVALALLDRIEAGLNGRFARLAIEPTRQCGDQPDGGPDPDRSPPA